MFTYSTCSVSVTPPSPGGCIFYVIEENPRGRVVHKLAKSLHKHLVVSLVHDFVERLLISVHLRYSWSSCFPLLQVVIIMMDCVGESRVIFCGLS